MTADIFEVDGRARDLRDIYLSSVKRRDALSWQLVEAQSSMDADGRVLTAYLQSIGEGRAA